MNKKYISAGLVLLSGCTWGCMGLLVRPLNTYGLNSIDISFIRAVITLIAITIWLLVFDRKAFKIRFGDIWCFIGTGALSIAFFNYCYFKTIVLTSLSVAAVLLYTAPAFVMIMSAILFKEKLGAKKFIALVLAFVGCCLVSGVVGGEAKLTLPGLLVGIGAGFGYALYSIFSRYAINKGYNSMTITFYTFLTCTITTACLTDIGKVTEVMTADFGLLIKTIFMVLFVTLIPYLAYTKGLNGLENGTASVIASVEPVMATVLGAIVYQEVPDLWMVAGIVLVLGSIVLVNMGDKGTRKGN